MRCLKKTKKKKTAIFYTWNKSYCVSNVLHSIQIQSVAFSTSLSRTPPPHTLLSVLTFGAKKVVLLTALYQPKKRWTNVVHHVLKSKNVCVWVCVLCLDKADTIQFYYLTFQSVMPLRLLLLSGKKWLRKCLKISKKTKNFALALHNLAESPTTYKTNIGRWI